jgi:hypothetical protein
MLNVQSKSYGNTLVAPRRTVPRLARPNEKAVASAPRAMQDAIQSGVNEVTTSDHYPGIVSLAIIVLGGAGAWAGVIGLYNLLT